MVWSYDSTAGDGDCGEGSTAGDEDGGGDSTAGDEDGGGDSTAGDGTGAESEVTSQTGDVDISPLRWANTQTPPQLSDWQRRVNIS